MRIFQLADFTRIIFMVQRNKMKIKNLPGAVWANFFLIVPAVLLFSLASCDKSSVIGLKVQPSNDLLHVNYIDTATLITKTVKIDSLRTDEMLIYTGDALLGTYIDPVFGKTSSSLYTQLRLTTNAPIFSVSQPIIDSVVLSLVYDTTYYYGKRLRVPQKVNVYQLLGGLSSLNSYFSGNTISRSYVDLANNYGFIPQPLKHFIIHNQPLAPQLRIPIDVNFGQTILNNQGSANLADNTAFQTFMKGFYITTENTASLGAGDGNILHFKLADSQSKLTLYYNDSLQYDLSLTGTTRFSHFSHDYASGINSSLAAQLSQAPPAQNNILFVQSMSGVKTKIEMPYLLNSANSGASAIDKAELVIKIIPDPVYQLDTFAAPPALVLFGINDDGTNYALPDAGEGPNYFGGAYNASTLEYRFNIARYIQQVVSGKLKNNGLNLLPSSGALYANRAVIGGGGGGNSNAYKMKLNISYTKLK